MLALAGDAGARASRQSRKLLKRVRPAIVVGFGGYPTVPPLLAARLASIPIIVHEQNAVVGRANRLLLRFGAVLATGFEKPKGGERARDVVHVGNPVRKAIIAAVRPYEPPAPDEPFRLLVFGGSQGARVFSEPRPRRAGAACPDESRWRISVVQQARAGGSRGDARGLRRHRRRGRGRSRSSPTWASGSPTRIWSSAAPAPRPSPSSPSIGRPAILVPYPHALDHDQAENARVLAEAGGGLADAGERADADGARPPPRRSDG